MTWRAGTVGWFLLAATIAGAGEPVAPLANSAQEIKELQKGQVAKDTGGKLSDGLPRMTGPTPGETPLEMPKPPRSEAEMKELKKKKEAQKNWLVDGVDQLGKNSAAKGRGARDTREAGIAGEDEEKLDSADPDYILKLYREQQKEVEAKAGAKQAAAPRADPFAPFLQDWLGTSPARGKFFDESLRKPGAEAVSTGPGGPPGPAGDRVFKTVEVASPGRGAGVEAAPNPYLAGLDLPALPEANRGVSPGALNLGPPTGSTDSRPVALPGGTPPAPREAGKKPMPPVRAEDEKYFPQLKRF